MGFLDDYEPVEDRLAKFWADNPNGRILTDLLPSDPGTFIVKAYVYRGPHQEPVILPDGADLVVLPTDFQSPYATGLAQETVADKGVNATSALENCETSAIGRALANLGYAAKGKRPSREEMAKVEPKAVTPWTTLFEKVRALKAWTADDGDAALQVAVDALAITSGADMTVEEADRIWSHVQGQYESREEQASLDV